MKSNKTESLVTINVPCPCSHRNTDFHKIAELNNGGIIIYHTNKICSEESVSSKSDYAFIFQSTEDNTITIADCVPDLDVQDISCPRCRRLFQHAQKIMQDLPAFNLNDIVGICNRCQRKINRDKSCCQCRKLLKNFIKSKICEPAKCKFWLDKIKDLITEDEILGLRKENVLRTRSGLYLDKLCKKKMISEHEFEVKDIFSDTHLSDSFSTRKAVRKKIANLEKHKSSGILMDVEMMKFIDIEKPSTHLGNIETKKSREYITKTGAQTPEYEKVPDFKPLTHSDDTETKRKGDIIARTISKHTLATEYEKLPETHSDETDTKRKGDVIARTISKHPLATEYEKLPDFKPLMHLDDTEIKRKGDTIPKHPLATEYKTLPDFKSLTHSEDADTKRNEDTITRKRFQTMETEKTENLKKDMVNFDAKKEIHDKDRKDAASFKLKHSESKKSVHTPHDASEHIKRYKSTLEHLSKNIENVPKRSKQIVHDTDKKPEIQYTKSEVDPFSTFSKSELDQKSKSTVWQHEINIGPKKEKDKLKLQHERKKDMDTKEKETMKKLKGQFSYFFPQSKSKTEQLSSVIIKKTKSKGKAMETEKTTGKKLKQDDEKQIDVRSKQQTQADLSKFKKLKAELKEKRDASLKNQRHQELEAKNEEREEELRKAADHKAKSQSEHALETTRESPKNEEGQHKKENNKAHKEKIIKAVSESTLGKKDDGSARKKIQADLMEFKRQQAILKKQNLISHKSKMQQELEAKKVRQAAEQKSRVESEPAVKIITKSPKKEEDQDRKETIKAHREISLKAESESTLGKKYDGSARKNIQADLNEFKRLQTILKKQSLMAHKSTMQQELEANKARRAAEQKSRAESEHALKILTKSPKKEDELRKENIKAHKEKNIKSESDSTLQKKVDENTRKKIQEDLNEFKKLQEVNKKQKEASLKTQIQHELEAKKARSAAEKKSIAESKNAFEVTTKSHKKEGQHKKEKIIKIESESTLGKGSRKKIQGEVNEFHRLQSDIKKDKDTSLKAQMQHELEAKKVREAAEKKANAEIEFVLKSITKMLMKPQSPHEKEVIEAPKEIEIKTEPESKVEQKVDEQTRKKIQAELQEFYKLQAALKKNNENDLKNQIHHESEAKKTRQAAEIKAKSETDQVFKTISKILYKEEGQHEKRITIAIKEKKLESESGSKVGQKVDEHGRKKFQIELNEFYKLQAALKKENEISLKTQMQQELEAKVAREAAEQKAKFEVELALKETVTAKLALVDHALSISTERVPSDKDILEKDTVESIIYGEKIYHAKHKGDFHFDDEFMKKQEHELQYIKQKYSLEAITNEAIEDPEVSKASQSIETSVSQTDIESNDGVIKYNLSDRIFIEKGWTILPTEKVVRKMNVYRMRPARPEFDWFNHNKNKRSMQYDTGEKLAEFDDKGHGRWYYRNGRLALDYYVAEEANTKHRFVLYSNGKPDECGRLHPVTILATFDHLGNGVVFDHSGKIRLKYNQTEGVVLDRGIGPVSHWKWHTLNDPPVLQQVMLDTQVLHKDRKILEIGYALDKDKNVGHDVNDNRNEDMLAIEYENFVREKSKKQTQLFKRFPIRMKALKINENFSLRVLDQATIYLIFRDGSTNIKLNLGMILDHHEIVDTDTADVGHVANDMERFPERSDSLIAIQNSLDAAQRYDAARSRRECRIRWPIPESSADQLVRAKSRAIRLPLTTLPPGQPSIYCKCKDYKSIFTQLI